MAETITAIVGALMQMQVGPLAKAVAEIDPESDAAYIPPDATLGEVTGSDPYYAERMGDDVRATTRMAGHAASALAAYAPVLKDMARDLATQWERERADAQPSTLTPSSRRRPGPRPLITTHPRGSPPFHRPSRAQPT